MKNQKMSAEEIIHLYIENFITSLPEHTARMKFLTKELDVAIKNEDIYLINLLNNQATGQKEKIDKCKTLIAFCNKLLKDIRQNR